MLVLYVGEILLAYASSAIKAVKNIKAKLAAKYRIRNLGLARQFLDIEITSESADSYPVSLGQVDSLPRFSNDFARKILTAPQRPWMWI